MKKILFIVIALLMMNITITYAETVGGYELDPNDAPVNGVRVVYLEDYKYQGLIDKNNKLIPLVRKYKDISPMMYDFLLVTVLSDEVDSSGNRLEKNGVIDSSGKEIFAPIYDSISFSRDGRFITSDRNKESLQLYDYSGNIIIPYEAGYTEITDIRGNQIINGYGYGYDYKRYHVQLNGKHGLLDIDGNKVTEMEYDFIDYGYHHEVGLVRAQKAGYYGYLNKAGKVVIPLQYKSSTHHEHGYIVAQDQNDNFGLISKGNKILIPFEYDNIIVNEDKSIIVDKGNKIYKYNLKSASKELIKEFEFQKIVEDPNDFPSIGAQNSISELKKYDYFMDYAFKNYKKNITREEFIYLAVKLFELFDEEIIKLKDSTVKFSDTLNAYALKAATVDLIDDIWVGEFGSKKEVTREELATIIVRILEDTNLRPEKADGTVFADDSEFSSWARESIYIAKANGLLEGNEENKFNPKGKVTTEEALVITSKIIKKYGDLVDPDNLVEEDIRLSDEYFETYFDESQKRSEKYTYRRIDKLEGHENYYEVSVRSYYGSGQGSRTLKRWGVIKTNKKILDDDDYKSYDSIQHSSKDIIVPLNHDWGSWDKRYNGFVGYNEGLYITIYDVDGNQLTPFGYKEYGKNSENIYLVKNNEISALNIKSGKFSKVNGDIILEAHEKNYRHDKEFVEIMTKYGSSEGDMKATNVMNIGHFGIAYFSNAPNHQTFADLKASASESGLYCMMLNRHSGQSREMLDDFDAINPMIIDFIEYAYSDKEGYEDVINRYLRDIASTQAEDIYGNPIYAVGRLKDRSVNVGDFKILYGRGSGFTVTFMFEK
ncbi:MAG: S-layer homology domain-containing protein [Firmicutes bacterium]|jgi:hypothetical protein|nr:S-layer homology domain-containing protein [Bacillota bacterium]